MLKNFSLWRRLAKDTSLIMSQLAGYIEPGLSEFMVLRQLRQLARKTGYERFSFTPLVASGPRTAEPHAKATARRLAQGDLVFVDFGLKSGGLCTDITRTFILGQPSRRQARVYRAVEEACRRSAARLGSGVPVAEVDLAARDYLKSKRLGKFFVHSTGHGVGGRVHVKPRIHYKSKEILKPGMVITIEPGVYIPEWGGVRIEDMYLITDTGAEKLTA
jgi:Xaa-Pro aminopeptidase